MEKSGNITVVKTNDNYEKVHISAIKNLSAEELGVYVKIMSFGEQWNLNIKGLTSVLNISKERVRKAIVAIEKEGYIVRKPVRESNGKMCGWDYFVYPYPVDEKERSCAGKGKTKIKETVMRIVTPNSKSVLSFERLKNCFSVLEYQYMEQSINEMSYGDFLTTPYWKSISKHLRRSKKYACEECGSTKNIQVHHKTYKHHGDELHHLDDLVCLCKECHKKKHNIE